MIDIPKLVETCCKAAVTNTWTNPFDVLDGILSAAKLEHGMEDRVRSEFSQHFKTVRHSWPF